MKVISYARVSTADQAESGLGLAAQQDAIHDYCIRQGWSYYEIVDGGASGKDMDRPGMKEALDLLASGEYDALVVAKLDRATRSVVDAADLIERAKTQGWKFVALDFGLDPTTPTGELVASILAAVAQWERRMIGQRISEALQAAKAEGRQVGRKREVDDWTVDFIMVSRSRGQAFRGIAANLNSIDQLTPSGKQWTGPLVRKVYIRELEKKQTPTQDKE